MNVKFKEVFNTPEEFEISEGEVLSKFIWNKNIHFLIFKQDDPYSHPNLLFVKEKDILEVLDEFDLTWEYIEKITSKCI